MVRVFRADAGAEAVAQQHEQNIGRSLFWPENPGEDFLTSQDWLQIREALNLSERELSVAMLIFEGHSRDGIAHRLCKRNGKRLSSETVRVYIDRLYQKARVSDRIALVLRILRIHRTFCEQTPSE